MQRPSISNTLGCFRTKERPSGLEEGPALTRLSILEEKAKGNVNQGEGIISFEKTNLAVT